VLESFGLTDVGRRRKLNEDSFDVDDALGLYVVCDGMGGHNAGEVASRMAMETIKSFVEKSEKEKEITWPYGLDVNLSFHGNRLSTAIKLANRRVFKAADSQEEYTGMGTTVVCALVAGNTLTAGWAGDSRCYLFRGNALSQVSRDDSWVTAAWSEGILTKEEIERHPLKNVITKAVGAKETIDPQAVEQALEDGDHVLVCSDGLHSMITDEKIEAILRDTASLTLEAIAKALVDGALEAGGKDNVSVIVLRYKA
jgi:protein phosphatase